MQIKFDEKELSNDILLLAGKDRITIEVAEELAQFKHIIDCAAHTWYDLSASNNVAVPVDILNSFERAQVLLEVAYLMVAESYQRRRTKL